ncbi:MAG TPA: Ig-like domain-containing protein, partial [Isosphaeraceae bacterium]|nr:Ig-like domain-containing protein [Isosphaeraceae bacterium]
PGSVVVNWGDGSAVQTLAAANLTLNGSPNGVVFTINASHTYAEEGTHAYTVTVTDVGGATTVISGSAKIADAPLTATAVQPTVDTTEAALFPLPVFAPPAFSGPVAEFSDGNPLPPTGSSSIADFTATIDWGDGTAPSAGTIVALLGTTTPTYAVTGSHTYADAGVNGGAGTYAIHVFVQDDGGSRLTLTNTAHVADIPITVTGQLNPASDSGVSNSDDITNVTQPDFFGKSEPLSHVTLSETLLSSGLSVPIGTVQAGIDGSWNIKSGISLADGSYRISASAVDQFGETTTAAPVVITSDLVIDTVGPVITGAFFNRLNGQVDYTIQDPSPTSGPPSGVWVNTMLDSSNYLLTKVHANRAYPGKWIVTNVTATPGAAPNSYDVAVTFNSGKPIRGGFYLFTIRDSTNGNSSVQDITGNHLDGVFYGSFPSGNGINGSDFVAMLSAYHFKIFAPQTIVGTASAANGGVGGPRVGAVHSGNFTRVVPVGGGPVFGTAPTQVSGTRTAHTKKAVSRSKLATYAVAPKSHAVKTAVHDDALKALADQTKPTRLRK